MFELVRERFKDVQLGEQRTMPNLSAERGPEKAGVGGSIPSLATTF